jgi:hypothetical protein
MGSRVGLDNNNNNNNNYDDDDDDDKLSCSPDFGGSLFLLREPVDEPGVCFLPQFRTAKDGFP